MDKKLFITFVIVLLLGLASCVKSNSVTTSKTINQDPLEKIYNSDPQRRFIGQAIEETEHPLKDIVSGKTYTLNELKGKPVIIETFSVGCPACAEGIKNYNYIYDKYKDKVTIIYLNINPYDTEENIMGIKNQYNGKDWIWVKFDENLKPFLDKYNLVGNDVTLILDKNDKIVYADSLAAPVSRIENSIIKVI